MQNKPLLGLVLLGGLVALTVSVTSASGYLTPLLAEEETFKLNIDRLDEEVYTAYGNEIHFDYDNIDVNGSSLAALNEGGYITNSVPLSGLKSIKATFDGELSVKHKFEGKDGYASTLTSLTSGAIYDFKNDRPDYFYLEASEETTLTGLELIYSCERRINEGHLGVEVKTSGIEFYKGEIKNLFDGDVNTYCSLNDTLHPGEYVEIDYLEIKELNSIDLTFKGDYIEDLYITSLQYSIDGEEFIEFCSPNSNDYSYISNDDIEFRYLRFTNIELPFTNWPSIAEIAVNDKPAVIYSDSLKVYQGTANNMFDGDVDTFFWFENLNPADGVNVTVRYDAIQTMESVQFFFKDPNGTRAFFDRALYSLDNINYYLIGEIAANHAIFETFFNENDEVVENILFKYIRFETTNPDVTNWPSIAEIFVEDTPFMSHSFDSIYEGSYIDAIDNRLDTHLWFGSVGVPNANATFHFPGGVKPGVVTVTYGGSDRLPGIEVSTDGLNYKNLKVDFVDDGYGHSIYKAAYGQTIKYLRLINNEETSTGAWVKILDINFDHYDETNVKLNGFAKGLHLGSLSNLFDGKDNTYAWFACSPNAGENLVIDLDMITTTSKIRILFRDGNNSGCYLENLEVSTNGEEWNTLVSDNDSNEVIYEGEEIEFRYIRLLSPNGNAYWTSIAAVEFEA